MKSPSQERRTLIGNVAAAQKLAAAAEAKKRQQQMQNSNNPNQVQNRRRSAEENALSAQEKEGFLALALPKGGGGQQLLTQMQPRHTHHAGTPQMHTLSKQKHERERDAYDKRTPIQHTRALQANGPCAPSSPSMPTRTGLKLKMSELQSGLSVSTGSEKKNRQEVLKVQQLVRKKSGPGMQAWTNKEVEKEEEPRPAVVAK